MGNKVTFAQKLTPIIRVSTKNIIGYHKKLKAFFFDYLLDERLDGKLLK